MANVIVDFDDCRRKHSVPCKSANRCNYHQGWHDGRQGKQLIVKTLAYRQGWIVGTSALEESENGESW